MPDSNRSSDAGNSLHGRARTNFSIAVLAAAAVGTLGGLIGLGGAEFRLPLLLILFGLAGLQAVIVNKAISLVVVASALAFRSAAVPFADVVDAWAVVANLLAGTLVGSWFGAGLATRLHPLIFHRVIALLLVTIAVVLAFGHETESALITAQHGPAQIVVGLVAGILIGVVAALLGVAGGELLIPALILLFGVDIKLAGTLSLVISLPTLMVGIGRYSRDVNFSVLRERRGLVFAMALGSVAGVFAGASLLPYVSEAVLLPILAAVLILSAIKVWAMARRADPPGNGAPGRS